MRAKVDIVSGFLGAGKTMLIKKLLSEELNKDKIVIIENEFGEVGIDGNILRKSNLAVKEINAGCICCTVNGDFRKAIEDVIRQYSPHRIIIEPSGVGKLSEIINLCRSQELRKLVEVNMLITVVDVQKFHTYIQNFSEFYKNQIINAKTIILSRTQKIDRNKVDVVLEEIRKINNSAIIITTPWDNLEGTRIVSIAENSKEQSFDEQVKKIKIATINANFRYKNIANLKNHNHRADETFQTWGIETSKIFAEEKIKYMFSNIQKENIYGIILRAKGIVQINENEWIQFDYVPGELEMRKTQADYSGRLCIIGSNLNKKMLAKAFI